MNTFFHECRRVFEIKSSGCIQEHAAYFVSAVRCSLCSKHHNLDESLAVSLSFTGFMMPRDQETKTQRQEWIS